MIFGYNTDVKAGDTVYHVQTEDRGEKNPVIDSVIYVKGRIVDRRRTPYRPGQQTTERLQEMVKQQHRELVDSIRNGTYVLPEGAPTVSAAAVKAPPPAAAHPEAPPPPEEVQPEAPPPAAVQPSLELTNAASLEADGKLVFRLRARDRARGAALPGASVRAVLAPGEDGETRAATVAAEDGSAEIRFDIPSQEDVAVLFQASANGQSEVFKFRLRQEEVE